MSKAVSCYGAVFPQYTKIVDYSKMILSFNVRKIPNIHTINCKSVLIK